MKYNEFAKDVHQNAVAHGFWETDRSFGEIIALCHSEISEALEEYRAGRSMAYVVHTNSNERGEIDFYNMIKHETDLAKWGKKDKPEGIAVELADCVIRCMDWFGRMNMNADDLLEEAKGGERWMDDMPIFAVGSFGDFIAHLNLDLSLAYRNWCNATGYWSAALRMAVCCNEIFEWAEREGVDMHELMRIKHEYNKGRPYKHGKVM